MAGVSYVIPPDNRSVGTGNPAQDVNELSDMEALLAAAVAGFAGQPGNSSIPADNAANVAAVQTLVTGSYTGPGLAPSGDTTGTTDTARLQAYFNGCSPGQPAPLQPGVFWTKTPVTVPQGIIVTGALPAQQGAGGSTSDWGTVIKPVAGFSGSGFNATAVLLISETSGPAATNRTHVRNLMIDGSSGPASVDGIAIYGEVNAVGIESILCQYVTGSSFAAYNDGSGNGLDGLLLRDCLAQAGTGYGYLIGSTDLTAVNCHAQSCGSDGWSFSGYNGRLIGCRSDLNGGHGFTFTGPSGSAGGGANSGYSDNITMVACGTQLNAKNGLNVVDAYTGVSTPQPSCITCTACSFDMDGVNGGSGGGGYAGIAVSGLAVVGVSNTRVMVDNFGAAGGSPEYAIATSASASGSRVPISIRVSGSSWLSAATAIVNDAAPSVDLSVDLSVITYTGTHADHVTSPGTPAQWSGATQNFGGVFGDGSMGAVTLTGTSTYTGITLSGGNYTLTRDLYAASLTISSGVTLFPAGYRIHCRGTLTNSGTITAAGNAASGATGGAATGAGSNGGGRLGGNSSTANGSNGAAGAGSNCCGAAGAGGLGSTGTAGSAGTTTGLPGLWYKMPHAALTGVFQEFNSSFTLLGAGGGGGGGGDGTNAGGAGGGGGGLVLMFAWNIVNSGTITAAGGNGASPAAGNTGGGGGGGGGGIFAWTLAAWAAGTTSVAGGTAGTGHGSGASGSNGSSGTVANVIVQ